MNTRNDRTWDHVLFLCPKREDRKSSGACRGETEVKKGEEQKNEFKTF